MIKLIPNDINVSEQLRIRNQFVSIVGKWKQSLLVNTDKKYLELELQCLEEDSGVRCHYTNHGELAGFKIVDEKIYAWFVLRWS